MTDRLQSALVILRSAVMQGLVHDYPRLKDSLRDVCEAVEKAGEASVPVDDDDVFAEHDPVGERCRANLAIQTLAGAAVTWTQDGSGRIAPAFDDDVKKAANKVLLDYFSGKKP